MNSIRIVTSFFLFYSFISGNGQEESSVDYDFINAVYNEIVLTKQDTCLLYYKQPEWNFSYTQTDSLNKYFSYTDIEYMKQQFQPEDTAFRWEQKYLKHCRVIQDEEIHKIRAQYSKYWQLSRMVYTSGKTVSKDTLINISKNLKSFYYFSKPVWTRDSSQVIIKVNTDKTFRGTERIYIFKKIDNKWIIISEIQGIDWMKA